MVDLIKGKYRVVREIARSNDIVYEAMDTALNRRLALKELNIPPSLTGQARRERIERFNREARAAGRLSHPNIVSVFEFGEENGRHFIAMEFLEGQSLRDMMQARGALPLAEALNIACQTLDALAYAHANRVIHRDIKPDNIHILPGGQVKLTDFGIARLTEEAALTGDGQVFGTPSYMSPEQIEGRGIDYRSDLFSLGIVLYEMLSGRKPFTGDSVVSITYAIMNAPPLPLPGVPPAIEQALFRALNKNPAHRYSTAEQMKQELRQAEAMPMMPLDYGAGLHRTGASYGYFGQSVPVPAPFPMQNGYTSQSQPYGGNVPAGYAPQQVPAAPPAADPSLPWNWTTGAANANPAAAGLPPGAVPAAQPFAPPRQPLRPIFVLSPGGRTFLTVMAGVVVLSLAIVGGVKMFLQGYDRFQVKASAERVTTLINEGVDTYNKGDYANAAAKFAQALDAQPNATERQKIVFNLAAAYNQLGMAAEKNSNWSEARDFYQKALAVSPENRLAHNGLANALEHLGDPDAARRERASAGTSATDLLPSDPRVAGEMGTGTNESGKSAPPPSLKTYIPPPDSGSDAVLSADAARQKARDLIDEGAQLFRNGDKAGARAKWETAISIAPGTDERNEAKYLLEQSENSGESGGQ